MSKLLRLSTKGGKVKGLYDHWIVISLAMGLAMSLILAGCAYTPKSILPEHIKRIDVGTFENKTFKYGLEDKLTDAVIGEFIVDGRLKVVSQARADALLTGVITEYVRVPLSYDANDLAEEYRVYLRVDVTMKDLTTGEVIWTQKGMEGSDSYWVSDKADRPVETEEEGIQRAVDDLARDIVNRAIEGW